MGTGKITTINQYSMDCFSCDANEVDCAVSRKHFIKESRADGWRLRNNNWICPSCVRADSLEKEAKKDA